MYNRNRLTFKHLEHGKSREVFTRLQNNAGLQAHGKARVDEAMKAAIAHVQKKRGLQLGITDKHIDMALGYLKHHYEGRKLLKPKEREVIAHSLDIFFGRKPEESKVEDKKSPVSKIEAKDPANENVWSKEETKELLKPEPKLVQVSPRGSTTNDGSYQKTA